MANLNRRTSKFRHVYGSQTRREQWFENVRITRNTHDSDFCSVNPKFLAVVLESSGGGTFTVLDVNKPGRQDINTPKVCGHAGAVMDVKFNPFNDHIIASGSEDTTVKLWTIPPNGLLTNLSDWSADLHGHFRKVCYLEWHPLAENVLMSVGFDKKIMIWNVDQAEPITSLPPHPDTIFSVSWGRDGRGLASTCKDKKVRVMDARAATVAVEMPGHASPKVSKCVFVNDHSIFTTGFSRSREYALWDIRNPKKAAFLQDLDSSSGILLPYFDPDTCMVYMAGKGDGMIRYVEVQNDPTDVFFLSFYQSSMPQRGLGMMPKRGVNTAKNELVRFYKLHASKDLVEPLPMIAPRKAEGFQHDIFPPTSSNLASLTADEWTSGINRGPILLNLEDGSIIDKPRTSMSAAVQSPMSNLSIMPEITTYKAVNKPLHAASSSMTNHAQISHQAPPPTALRTSPDGLQSCPETNEHAGYDMTDRTHSVPSSIKNIQRLSMNFERDSHSSNLPHPYSSSSASSSPSPSSLTAAQSLSSLRTSPAHQPSPSPFHNQPSRTASCTVLNGANRNEPAAGSVYQLGNVEEQEPYSFSLTPTTAKNFMTNENMNRTTPPSVMMMTTKQALPSSSFIKPGRMSSPQQLQLHQSSSFAPSSSPSLSPLGHVSAAKLVLGVPALSPISSPRNTSPPANAIHVRKVWTPPSSPANTMPQSPTGTGPATDSELKKAYFRQLGEIKSLQEQLSIKDKRIKDLEAELARALTGGAVPNSGESNC